MAETLHLTAAFQLYAAAQQSRRYSRLQAPATNCTGTRRSPISGDLLVFWAAVNIAASLPLSYDPELALLRHQDNRINQSTEHLRRFQACVLALERRGEVLDLRSVEVGHAWMQQGRRLIRGFELLRQYLLAVMILAGSPECVALLALVNNW